MRAFRVSMELVFGVMMGAVLVTFGQSPLTATVSWLAPTQNVDTTALNPGDIDHYTLTWTATSAGGPSGSMNVPGSALSVIVPFGCGQANFTISATTSASARYPNATSGSTSPVFYDSQVKCASNPPAGLAVQSSAAKPK